MSYRNTEISQEWTVVFYPEALDQLAEPLQRPCHRRLLSATLTLSLAIARVCRHFRSVESVQMTYVPLYGSLITKAVP